MVKPTISDNTAEFILSHIRDGMSARKACELVDVRRSTFFDLMATEAWAGRYAQARDARLDAWIDEIDDATTNVPLLNEAIAARRLRIDTLKWTLSKLRPGTYGEKVRNEHTGADGGPIQQRTEIVPLMDEQVAGGVDALRAITGGTEPRRPGKTSH